MQSANPYRAPLAHVADPTSEGVSKIKIWSAKGRLGRVRYIGYSVGLALLIMFVSGFLAVTVGAGHGAMIMFIGMATVLFVHFLLSVQRAHDCSVDGWVAIIAFVPLLNFVLWFIPGTDGDNRFGPKTPPNGALAVVLACISVVMMAGIVAAIAIPTYHPHAHHTQSVEAN